MKIRVEVVYALPDEQTTIAVELDQGARVADALAASRLQALLPHELLTGHHLGIWGVPASPESELRDRDRVEVYRMLVADPKQARRQRVNRQRPQKVRR